MIHQPIDMAALFIALLGLVMLIAEIFLPTFGLLGLAGLAVFVWGASHIFYGDAMMMVWGFSVTILIVMAIAGAVMYRARNRRDTAGIEGMIGEKAEIVDWDTTTGRVQVQGELWQAKADMPSLFAAGEIAMIDGADGLVLKIRKAT